MSFIAHVVHILCCGCLCASCICSLLSACVVPQVVLNPKDTICVYNAHPGL
jgi:hypothetical protein